MNEAEKLFARIRRIGKRASTDLVIGLFEQFLTWHSAQVWEEGFAAGHECVGAKQDEHCAGREANPYRWEIAP